MPTVGCWGSSNKPQPPGLQFPLNLGYKKPEFYEISFLIIYILSSEAAQQDCVCANACVHLCMCVCVCAVGVGVSLYCPKIQAKGNFTGHTHKYLPPTVPPLTFVSEPGLGGRSPGRLGEESRSLARAKGT